ncbi:N-acetylmuramoyl-L-alanine amidase family protein [Paenibacillus sp. NPDC058071]|uniref:peptidoglycan recognition protein family protein n=1 Tax=Paenibacillus sp. NPDC058071 TaxID=3346326 RepID=UPI0036D97B10
MISITVDLIPINPFSRDGGKLKAKKGIVMHYTASPGAPAANIGRYFSNLRHQNPNDSAKNRYAGAHYSVDRFTIIQSIPINERAYHCGSTSYTKEALDKLGSYPNNTTIGIEMCIEKDGSIHEDTFRNAADLVAYLVKVKEFPEVIFTHKGVVGWKDCPLPWVKKPSEFERFRRAVSERLRRRLPLHRLFPSLRRMKIWQ